MDSAKRQRHIVIVVGGTAGAVMAARLSEDPGLAVTLLEAGPDHDAYGEALLEPRRAAEAWDGVGENFLPTTMKTERGATAMIQGRLLGGTSAVNGLATLRVADASVMPTIPAGNTYLGCVMVAERIARKMKRASG